jgi:hypothetical protein
MAEVWRKHGSARRRSASGRPSSAADVSDAHRLKILEDEKVVTPPRREAAAHLQSAYETSERAIRMIGADGPACGIGRAGRTMRSCLRAAEGPGPAAAAVRAIGGCMCCSGAKAMRSTGSACSGSTARRSWPYAVAAGASGLLASGGRSSLLWRPTSPGAWISSPTRYHSRRLRPGPLRRDRPACCAPDHAARRPLACEDHEGPDQARTLVTTG